MTAFAESFKSVASTSSATRALSAEIVAGEGATCTFAPLRKNGSPQRAQLVASASRWAT